MSYLRYNEGKIVEQYRVWITHIFMTFLTLTISLGLIVLFFKILLYLSTGRY